jgi:tetratricopeptide (TPR) repeat protein
MTARPFFVSVAAMSLWFGAAAFAAAQDKGQADLDKAIEGKLTANSFEELGEVINHCQSALDLGLDAENTKFAKQLLAATLLQRASALSEAAVRTPPTDQTTVQQFLQLRLMAVNDLERAVRHDPTQPESQYLLGRMHALPGGDRKRAMTALDEAIKLKGDDDSIQVRALVLRSTLQTDPEKRLADCNEAVKITPNSLEALRARATVLLEQNKVDEGIVDLDAALKLDPKHGGTYELKGAALAAQQKFPEALAALDKAVLLEPKNPAPLFQRARVHLAQDKAKEALADLDDALKLQPGNPTMLILRAAAHQALDHDEDALADVDMALKVRPGFVPALRARASLLAGSGKFDLAITDLEELKKAEPKDPRTLLQLAVIYAANKQTQLAIDTYGAVLEVDPKNASALAGRADMYLRVGKHAVAIADYEAVLKENPKNDHVLNNLAWTLATSTDDKVRDGKRAIDLATEACKLTDYKQAHLLSTLASGYAEIGDFKTAIEWSKKAVETAEGDVKDALKKELESYEAGKPWREAETPEPADKPDEKKADGKRDFPAGAKRCDRT